MITLIPELRSAVRSLLRQRLVAIAAMLSVAVAIGAGACAFSVVDAIRFRALPFAQSDGLVFISELPADAGATAPKVCPSQCTVSYASFSTILRARPLRSLSVLTAFSGIGKVLTRDGRSDGIIGAVATPALFTVMRAVPLLGRAFTDADDRIGAEPVIVLSYDFWAGRFGADTALIGSSLQFSGTQYSVIGVMPPGFDFESGSKYWLPLAPVLDPNARAGIRNVTVIARLAPGITIGQARAEVSALEPAQQSAAASIKEKFYVAPLRERYELATRGIDLVFLAVVACVLLIATVNLANLLLVRALDQQRDAAVRTALGASPARLVTQLLLQHALVVVAGTALGLALAAWAIPIVGSATVLNVFRPTAMSFRLDARVAATAVTAALGVLALVSIAPARLVSDGQVVRLLREGAATAAGTRARLQRAFVVVQLAASVVLLIAAGLETRTVQRLSHVDLGFDAAHVVQGVPSYPPSWRVPATYVPITQRILDGLGPVPGVDAVAVFAAVPAASSQFTLVGDAAPLSRTQAPDAVLVVSPGYFRALRIPIVSGRAFAGDDRERTEAVAVVNEWSAGHWWPDGDAVGKLVRIDTAPGLGTTVRVVGVAHDNRAVPGLVLASAGPALYRPFEQAPSPFPAFVAHAIMPAASVVRPMQAVLAREVPDRPLYVQPFSAITGQQISTIRVVAVQVVATAVMGFFLAIVGMYGVVAFTVSRRTREFGIRRALGASEAGILAMVVGEALVLSGAALVLGGAGATVLGRALGPVLHGTSPSDPAAWMAAVVVVVAGTVAFALVPARRAARIAPVSALRAD